MLKRFRPNLDFNEGQAAKKEPFEALGMRTGQFFDSWRLSIDGERRAEKKLTTSESERPSTRTTVLEAFK